MTDPWSTPKAIKSRIAFCNEMLVVCNKQGFSKDCEEVGFWEERRRYWRDRLESVGEQLEMELKPKASLNGLTADSSIRDIARALVEDKYSGGSLGASFMVHLYDEVCKIDESNPTRNAKTKDFAEGVGRSTRCL